MDPSFSPKEALFRSKTVEFEMATGTVSQNRAPPPTLMHKRIESRKKSEKRDKKVCVRREVASLKHAKESNDMTYLAIFLVKEQSLSIEVPEQGVDG